MNNNQIMAAVIKLDVDESYKKGSFYAREFAVPYNVNIEELMETIKKFGTIYHVPITRVYLSGHKLEAPNLLWDKDKIENYFKAAQVTPDILSESAGMKR